MALVGGGGAGNVAGSNPSGIGSTLQYIRTAEGTWCYAYSGAISANATFAENLNFTTGPETVIANIHVMFMTNAGESDDYTWQVLFNEQVVYEVSRGNNIERFPQDTQFVIPGYTHVVVQGRNITEDEAHDIGAMITGRVY